MCNAGHEEWGHYWSHPPEDAFFQHHLLEGEGEKVADYAASAGFVCISHPGHDRSDQALQRRYRRLKSQGVQGVINLADADPQGLDLGRRCRDAAAAVGLPFIGIDMRELFPDLPKGGSLDDMGNVTAAIQVILDAVNEDPPAQQPSQENCAEPASPATPADPEDSPAEAPLRKVDPEARAAFTFDDLLPPALADAAALLSEAWPTDPLTVSLTYLAAISGALPIGSRVAASATFDTCR